MYVNLYYWVDDHPQYRNYGSWHLFAHLKAYLSVVFLHVLQPMPSQIKANGTPQKKAFVGAAESSTPCKKHTWLILFVILMVPRLNSWLTNLTIQSGVVLYCFFLNCSICSAYSDNSFRIWGTYIWSYNTPPFPPPLGSVHRHLHASSINSGLVTFIGRLTLVDAPSNKKRRCCFLRQGQCFI